MPSPRPTFFWASDSHGTAMPGMALDPQHCLPPGIIQRGRAAHADPVCSSWVHFDKTLHKLLQGYTMMYSECVKVNGTRSNVFPLSFHVFDINSYSLCELFASRFWTHDTSESLAPPQTALKAVSALGLTEHWSRRTLI